LDHVPYQSVEGYREKEAKDQGNEGKDKNIKRNRKILSVYILGKQV
jgi:hypothetical protein